MVEIEVYSKSKSKARQPQADWLPKLPCLLACSGPSMSGKGVLIQRIIRNEGLYHTDKGEPAFGEAHVWTGSTREDINLAPFKKWAEDVLHMGPDKSQQYMIGIRTK